VIERPAVASLLACQFGVVATEQLIEAGIARRSIVYACRRGAMESVLPGVLHAAGQQLSFQGRAMAAQLCTAPDGVLSGPTAARLFGLRQMPTSPVYVTGSQRHRIKLPAWVHHVRRTWLHPEVDTAMLYGCLRVLRPVAMLMSLAELFNDHRFERAAEDAWHLRLVSPDAAREYLESVQGHGRVGVARFRRWLEQVSARTRPSQSGFEMDVLAAIQRVGLPVPARQHPVRLASGEVVHIDIAWPDVQFGVEPGHSWWHGGDLRMQADQARDSACAEVGWHIVRYGESARGNLDGVGRELQAMYNRRCHLFRGRM
jgi:hypothetical protein